MHLNASSLESTADYIRLVNIFLCMWLIILVLTGARRAFGLDVARLALASWGFSAAYASYSLMGDDDNWRRPSATFISIILSLVGVALIRYNRKKGQPTGLPEDDSGDPAQGRAHDERPPTGPDTGVRRGVTGVSGTRVLNWTRNEASEVS